MHAATNEDQVLAPLDVFEGARMAIVHEWVAARAGSEKVFEAFAQLFPEADLYALTHSPGVHLNVGDRRVRTTWLDRWNHVRERRNLTLPLMPLAWQLMPQSYDVVISSSHAFARSFPATRNAFHFSYVHAPARYLWTPEIDQRRPHWWAKPAVQALRRIDLSTVKHTDCFAANSTEVAERIRRFYGRDAMVIPPPVDTTRFQRSIGSTNRSGLLCLGRWIPYKRVDLALRAAALAEEPLTVAGSGPMALNLQQLACDLGSPVRFIHAPTDEEVVRLMGHHRALLFPGREDFGIVPVEAAAAGLPVIAYGAGGALDTVVHGATGLLVPDQAPRAFADAIIASRNMTFNSNALALHAASFSSIAFRTRVARALTDETSG